MERFENNLSSPHALRCAFVYGQNADKKEIAEAHSQTTPTADRRQIDPNENVENKQGYGSDVPQSPNKQSCQQVYRTKLPQQHSGTLNLNKLVQVRSLTTVEKILIELLARQQPGADLALLQLSQLSLEDRIAVKNSLLKHHNIDLQYMLQHLPLEPILQHLPAGMFQPPLEFCAKRLGEYLTRNATDLTYDERRAVILSALLNRDDELGVVQSAMQRQSGRVLLAALRKRISIGSQLSIWLGPRKNCQEPDLNDVAGTASFVLGASEAQIKQLNTQALELYVRTVYHGKLRALLTLAVASLNGKREALKDAFAQAHDDELLMLDIALIWGEQYPERYIPATNSLTSRIINALTSQK